MPHLSLFCRLSTVCVLALFTVVIQAGTVSGKTVALPLTLDHSLLTSLLIQSAFPEKEQSAYVVGAGDDCVQVTLSKPVFTSENDLLRLEMKLFIRAGKELGASCVFPVEWQGYLELYQKPYVIATGVGPGTSKFDLAFKTIDSRLLTVDKEPAKVAGFLWSFAKPEVNAHLDRVRIDLAPPLDDLTGFLAMMFQEEFRVAAMDMLTSLHTGGIDVNPGHVQVKLLVDTGELSALADRPDPTPLEPLSREEQQQLLALWETWDSFLVHLLTTLAKNPLSLEDRQVLVDVLLQTRHGLIRAQEESAVNEDFVRKQFLQAWQSLAPVFRNQLYFQATDNSLGYLAFFTAADALAVLDAMGPSLGIEISEKGFLRLAKMLTGEQISLPYNSESNTRLQEIFELEPEKGPILPPIDVKEIEVDEGSEDSPLSWFLEYMLPPLYAAETGKKGTVPGFKEILKWQVPKKNTQQYVKRVRAALSHALKTVLSKETLPVHLHPMMSNLIPAVAWQESCFRQFIIKKKKLTYLLSYNSTSVGLMQINERVWRGLYNRQRLRWDIHYNARAGCEIIQLYLQKYALRKKPWIKASEHKTLSRILYSMYNGGPGQYQRFFVRDRDNAHYRSDELFAEKLQWAHRGQWEKVELCFTGG